MYNHLGYLENSTNFNILQYAMTGFGIDNAEAEFFNETYRFVENISHGHQSFRETMHAYYMRWRGERTQYEMFDFMYNKNGYTCQDMFQTCYGGSVTYNCCEIFQPTYAMLRGRFRAYLYEHFIEITDASV